MSKVYTTEITSEDIPSDNPIHQRLLKPYLSSLEYITGNVLEIGCGEGRGIARILERTSHYTAIDKIAPVLEALKIKYPQGTFLHGHIPPLPMLRENTYDVVISFQVIEHIGDDALFLEEISRVLKPGGIALITTPNRPKSLTRNPWHVREYTAAELTNLATPYFSSIVMRGITGNGKVMEYYEKNRQSVERLTRFDILDLQHRLPASWLRIPYELLNRWNRNKLKDASDNMVREMSSDDYLLTDQADEALDLFLMATK
jgi:SAM-dependent methyltransferase